MVYGLAEEAGWRVRQVIREGDLRARATRSNWLLVSANTAFLESPGLLDDSAPPPAPIFWTDSFSSLLGVWSR